MESFFRSFGFKGNSVDDALLSQKNKTPSGNLKIFHHLNLDPGHGPKYGQTGMYVITYIPNKGWCVLMARKCFGGDSARNLPGERFKVGHTNYQGNPVPAFGPKSGAAGTKSKFWGKWVSIGGSNDPSSTSNIHAGLIEFRDEANVDRNITQNLHIIDSYTYTNTLIYVAYLPHQYASQIDTSRGTKKELIFSSHGEIAELRWVPHQHVVDNSILKNGLADYVEETYIKHVWPLIEWLKLL